MEWEKKQRIARDVELLRMLMPLLFWLIEKRWRWIAALVLMASYVVVVSYLFIKGWM